MINLNIYTTLIGSIVIQVITGIIEITSLFIRIPVEFSLLKEMMVLELFVQLIEGSFYIYWLYDFKNILNITPNRYFDWVITTPTMLINLIFYLIFLQYKDNNTTDKLTFLNLCKTEFSTIITVLLLNWMMLLFGYLGEISAIPQQIALSLISFSIAILVFSLNFLLSFKPWIIISDFNITAADTIGPLQGPRPVSSTPQTISILYCLRIF